MDASTRHALDVDRVIAADAETVFDAFIGLYGADRPDWVTDSRLDLREGGRWDVAFQVPAGPAFREERVITALDRPRRLAYEVRAVYQDAPGFVTTVVVTVEPAPDGHRLRLVQQGFPTAGARDEFAGAWPDVLAEIARRVESGGAGHPS